MLLPFPSYSLDTQINPRSRLDPQIEICTYLAHFGHQIIWLIPSEENQRVEPFFFRNAHVYVTPCLQGTSILMKIINKLPNVLRKTRLAIKIVKREKCNIIFARDEDVFDGLIAVYIKRRYKIPFVFELVNPLEMESGIYKIHSRKPRFLFYLIANVTPLIRTHVMKKAELVLPTTRWFEDALVRKGISKLKLMPYPNGVDSEFFLNKDGENVRGEYHLNHSRVIIYVGVIGKGRCLQFLIQAFSKVRRVREDVKLLMVGEGGRGDVENLERLADNLGMKEDIIFTRWVPHSGIPNFIAAADIGVSPVPPFSFFTVSSPIKMFEYMAMAKPVIANEEIREHKEVLEQSGGGILVPFKEEAFANAIIELLDNPEKATEMGWKGKEWVMENRTYDKLARDVERAYYEVIQKRGAIYER